jgi:outer membrane protein assembly factor BamD
MKKTKFLIFIVISLFIFSCSKKEKINSTIIKEKSLELQVLESYKEGMKELESGDALFAAKKFNEVETIYPQSDWAPKSVLMAAYAYYSQDYYYDAIEELKIFLKRYPYHENLDYAHYLMGINYYEQIIDEKKDLKSIINAKEKFEYVLDKFPDTDYALDSKFKLDLILNILASKEMYIGRYYVDKAKWIPAINRFKKVINEYEQTIFVEEALHRLVEIYYLLGLESESKKYASLLGYNYQSSRWYEQTYSIFDKEYNFLEKKQKKKSNFLIKRFKTIFQ